MVTSSESGFLQSGMSGEGATESVVSVDQRCNRRCGDFGVRFLPTVSCWCSPFPETEGAVASAVARGQSLQDFNLQ